MTVVLAFGKKSERKHMALILFQLNAYFVLFYYNLTCTLQRTKHMTCCAKYSLQWVVGTFVVSITPKMVLLCGNSQKQREFCFFKAVLFI